LPSPQADLATIFLSLHTRPKSRYYSAAGFADRICNWPHQPRVLLPGAQMPGERKPSPTVSREMSENVHWLYQNRTGERSAYSSQRIQAACLFASESVFEVLAKISHQRHSSWHMPCTTHRQRKDSDSRQTKQRYALCGPPRITTYRPCRFEKMSC
jgi:hypothetical protein